MGKGRFHVVKTWGEKNETENILMNNGYEDAKNIFGKYYYCTKIGSGLYDVEVLV